MKIDNYEPETYQINLRKLSQNIVLCHVLLENRHAAAYDVTYAMSDRVPWPVIRACSAAGRHIQYVCRYQGPILRETIKGAHHVRPNRAAYLFLRRAESSPP